MPLLPRRPLLLGLGALAFPAGALLAPRPARALDRTVRDAAQLRAALAAARPGDRVLLAPGATFEGDFAATRPGTAAAPIVIRCARVLGATVTGRFTVAAADVALVGLVVRKGVALRGDRARVGRCRVDDPGTASAVEVEAGTGAVVELCELTGFASQAVRVAGAARSPLIRRNWVHGQAPPPDPLDVAAVIVGTGKGTSATRIGARVLENLVEGLAARQAIELKSSGNLVEGNTAVGSALLPADVFVRHGLDNALVRNWVEDGRVLLGDRRNAAVRNRCAGALWGPCVGLMKGTITGDRLRAGAEGYPVCEDARAIANEARVVVGWEHAPLPGRPPPEPRPLRPVRTRVEAHDRSRWPVWERSVDPGQVARLPTTDWVPPPEAPRRLDRAEVGPFAPA